MATTPDFIAYVAEQADLPGRLSHRKMFGEYALYVDGKVVALVCNNEVYLKSSEAVLQRVQRPVMGSPYPGAKAHLQMNEWLEDRSFFQSLLLATAQALPAPQAKSPKPSKRGAMMATTAQSKGPASYFPSIEKTYGQPMDHWFSLVATLGEMKHMEQVAWLKSQHGLGHGHANAIVAHVKSLKAG